MIKKKRRGTIKFLMSCKSGEVKWIKLTENLNGKEERNIERRKTNIF